MRMTPRKQTSAAKAKPKKKKADWGTEPDDDLLDADGNPPDVHDPGTHAMPGPDPDVVKRRASDLVSDKATLQKVEAELEQKRKALLVEQAKLAPLETEAKKLRDAIHRQHAEVVADNIDALLLIVPEHERTSCSDEDPNNEGRCTRCTLLYIKENHWDAANFKFEVTVSPR